jgi:hypothetical protein
VHMPDPKLDQEESIRLAKQIEPEHSQCWWNASRAVRDVLELCDAWYVEGVMVVVIQGAYQHFDHGWVETPQGAILDPTLAMHPAARRERLEHVTADGQKKYHLVWPARYPLRGGKRDWPIAYLLRRR